MDKGTCRALRRAFPGWGLLWTRRRRSESVLALWGTLVVVVGDEGGSPCKGMERPQRKCAKVSPGRQRQAVSNKGRACEPPSSSGDRWKNAINLTFLPRIHVQSRSILPRSTTVSAPSPCSIPAPSRFSGAPDRRPRRSRPGKSHIPALLRPNETRDRCSSSPVYERGPRSISKCPVTRLFPSKSIAASLTRYIWASTFREQ